MSLLSTLYSQYSISPIVSNGIEIIYSYNVIDPVVSYIDFAYRYSDPDLTNLIDFFVGRKAPYTQQILNNLPPWMEMRKNYNSNGSLLVNAWGQNLERIVDQYALLRQDQFLFTADLYSDVKISVSELASKGQKIYQPVFNNILYNSSFSIKAPARFNKPLGWSVDKDADSVSFDPDNSIFGSHGISLDGTIGASQLNQTRTVAIASGPITFSIFIKTALDTGLSSGDRWESQEAGLIMSIWYNDNTVETFGVGFSKNTSNSWSRTSLTATLARETYKIEVHIVNRSDYKYIVDCPFLCVGNEVTEWTPNNLDVLPYTSALVRTIAGVQVLFDSLDTISSKKIEVFPISSENEFRYIKVPTRIEPIVLNKDSSKFFNHLYSRHINALEELMPTAWGAYNGYIRETSYTSPDILSDRKPADLVMTEEGDLYFDKGLIEDNNTEVKAVCSYEDILYVVTKETYNDNVIHCLKIVEPRVISYTDTYMPSVGDVEIPIQLGTSFGPQSSSEEVTAIGICKAMPNCIFIDTSLDRRLYYRLFYDYFYADYGVRRVYCRENYSKDSGRLQII